MKKIIALLLSLTLLTACGGASSETPENSTPAEDTLTIGVVQLMEHPSLNEIYKAFSDELVALGYDDTKITLEYQNGQGDASLINSISQKFVGDEVDMILAIATSAAQGAAAATTEIPIVFSAVTDPIAAGLTASLEVPDANATGTSDRIPVERILDLADELTPGIKTYGLIYNNGEVNSVSVIEEVKVILNARGIKFIESVVTNSGEVTTAAQSLIGKVDAIFSPIDNTVANAMPNLAQIGLEAKLPIYVAADSMVADGGLATVGVNYTQLGKQTAAMAVKILEGAKVSEVPVEVLDEYSVVVNEDIASQLGIDVSKYVK